jgi:hypothetical protein
MQSIPQYLPSSQDNKYQHSYAPSATNVTNPNDFGSVRGSERRPKPKEFPTAPARRDRFQTPETPPLAIDAGCRHPELSEHDHYRSAVKTKPGKFNQNKPEEVEREYWRDEKLQHSTHGDSRRSTQLGVTDTTTALLSRGRCMDKGSYPSSRYSSHNCPAHIATGVLTVDRSYRNRLPSPPARVRDVSPVSLRVPSPQPPSRYIHTRQSQPESRHDGSEYDPRKRSRSRTRSPDREKSHFASPTRRVRQNRPPGSTVGKPTSRVHPYSRRQTAPGSSTATGTTKHQQQHHSFRPDTAGNHHKQERVVVDHETSRKTVVDPFPKMCEEPTSWRNGDRM